MFRFTIRDVLWLAALTLVGVGWWMDRSSLQSVIKDFARKWMDHAEREHPGEELRQLRELTGGKTD